MRRAIILALTALEMLVLSAILTCSVQLSRELRTSDSVGRAARAVIATARRLADLRITVRYRA